MSATDDDKPKEAGLTVGNSDQSKTIDPARIKIELRDVNELMGFIKARTSIDTKAETSALASDSPKLAQLISNSPDLEKATSPLYFKDVAKLILTMDPYDFLDKAYQRLLLRSPDQDGRRNFLHKIQSAQYNKLDVLFEMARSHEAQIKNTQIVLKEKQLSFLLFLTTWRQELLPRLFWKILRLVRPNTQVDHGRVRQHLYNKESDFESLQENLNILSSAIGFSRDTILDHEKRFTGSKSEIAALKRNIVELGDRQTQLSVEIDEIKKNANREMIELIRSFEARLTQLRTVSEKQQTSGDHSGIIQNESAPRTSGFEQYYLDFENHFRGSEEEIKERLKVYLPQLDASFGMCIDIGCGRGEWISLLKENGFEALGIDINQKSVDYCRSKGLAAEQQDALDLLKSLPSGTIGLVTAFHVVEHMPWNIVLELIEESFRVLKVGGSLILETPNPENVLVGSCYFYHDPTHKNPIVPGVLEFTAKYFGFDDVRILRLQQANFVSRENSAEWAKPIVQAFNAAQDFAIVGKKSKELR